MDSRQLKRIQRQRWERFKLEHPSTDSSVKFRWTTGAIALRLIAQIPTLTCPCVYEHLRDFPLDVGCVIVSLGKVCIGRACFR